VGLPSLRRGQSHVWLGFPSLSLSLSCSVSCLLRFSLLLQGVVSPWAGCPWVVWFPAAFLSLLQVCNQVSSKKK
jgi:hypothetical protein